MKRNALWLAILFGALAAAGMTLNRMKKPPQVRQGDAHVAIIGGADGPTAIFVAGKSVPCIWRVFWVRTCLAVSRFQQWRVRRWRSRQKRR
ncbi:hypothetical protein [Clostridium sp. D33t1_170424_F3]|uniref:hypothetical protein n=1 Tax=Clostridium sp. D33t1_170424_F3 TaxID=2787099 RepID=UPI0018ABC7F2|nr:hypothetical protein [Clostridium sp. D33t1_170424_F3]